MLLKPPCRNASYTFVHHLRRTEVQNLGLFSLRYEDVCGLEVPVNDASRVGSIQRIRDLTPKRQYRFDFQWLSADPMLQGHAIKEFHDDEGLALVLADLVDVQIFG
jgi:hypothetical protein